MSMMRKYMAAVLAMSAMAGGRDIYDLPPSASGRTQKLLDKHEKERNHRLNPVDLSEREFIIRGEAIMAHDRKTALKIYANRHPEIKKKGKKRNKR